MSRSQDKTGEALCLDEDHRLIYIPNTFSKTEICAANAEFNALGVGVGAGGTVTESQYTSTNRNAFFNGAVVRFISFNQFARKHMKSKLEGDLIGRIRWLDRALHYPCLRPSGYNHGFLQTLSNMWHFDEWQIFKKRDLRVTCETLQYHKVKQKINGSSLSVKIPSANGRVYILIGHKNCFDGDWTADPESISASSHACHLCQYAVSSKREAEHDAELEGYTDVVEDLG